MGLHLAYNIDLDVAGLMILVILYIVVRTNYSVTDDLIQFRRFLVAAALTVAADIATCVAIGSARVMNPLLASVIYMSYYDLQMLAGYYMCCYIAILKKRRGGGDDYHSETLLPGLIFVGAVILMIINLFMGFFNRFDRELGYSHGPFFGLMFILPLIMVFISISLLIRARSVLRKWEIRTILILYTLLVVGIALRVTILPEYMPDGFLIALGALGILFSLETPDYRSLMKTMDDLERATRIKDNFLISITHEVRTPINTMLGMNELILRKSDNDEVRECAENAVEAGNTLLSLVNDLLDLSKVESGTQEIVNAEYEPASLINDCYNMISDRAASKGLEFTIICEETIPSLLKGDMIRIRQVMINMLTNAVKYTDKGSIIMEVRGREIGEGRVNFIIKVSDTGIGIREEDLPKVFEKFGRADLPRNRSIEGTGLGMPLSKGLCQAMNGDIEVMSTFGKGSIFIATIPQEVVDPTPLGTFKIGGEHKNIAPMKYHLFNAPKAKILIVDDTKLNLKLIKKLLEPTQVQVTTAESGPKALSLLEEEEYDLIFMDHLMPDMDGIETYKLFKESNSSFNKNTPVIMLTANAMRGMKEEYLAMGFDDYLGKPVIGEKLEQMIIKWLPADLIELL
ncbi:ATP-binding response regulator [Butyrivibrio sp. MC2013]|uniref:ATP-binding response regulator n=1 Tax=Butyrivibrio sp. MC2013 TaxID=1280686 RepID=UPI00041E4919|nr:response regulator [Butyrivibrio sp. MC2013]